MAQESILVVEDTELLRRIYVDKLEMESYNVLAAADGMEALSLVRTNHVDLILLDLVMPRMSGIEALEALKNDPRTRDIPVIILSNLGQDDDLERGMALGALDYLVKNASRPADVTAKIRETLDSLDAAAGALVTYSVYLRDHEGDADRLATEAGLPRRFWCPACEEELVIRLTPKPEHTGEYVATITCPRCSRQF